MLSYQSISLSTACKTVEVHEPLLGTEAPVMTPDGVDFFLFFFLVLFEEVEKQLFVATWKVSGQSTMHKREYCASAMQSTQHSITQRSTAQQG